MDATLFESICIFVFLLCIGQKLLHQLLIYGDDFLFLHNSFILAHDIQQFLITAAYRHNVFNYERIANYYAHASESVQLLFEQSALVLIDFDSAIEFGFARVSEELSAYYAEDYPDAE